VRDFKGLIVPQIKDPIERENAARLDYFLRDLSRGMRRISDGTVPDGSGTSILDAGPVSDNYWYLPGRSGNQLAFGGTSAGGTATISSTAHATKGFVYLGEAKTSAFDEVNERIGLEVAAPAAKLDMLVPTPVAAADQTKTPSADITDASFLRSDNGLNVSLFEMVDETIASDTDYIYAPEFTDPVILRFPSVTDPGINTGHVLKIRARYSAAGSPAASGTVLASLTGDGPIITARSPDGGAVLAQGTWTTFVYTLSEADAALFTAYGNIRVTIDFNEPGEGTGYTCEVSWVELTVPSVPGAAAETLQKWATSLYTNSLDFAADGTGGATLDILLSGDNPLRISAGGGTSGLRFLTSSTNGRLEVGTSAQANMNLVLSGARDATGTLLTSKFTNNSFPGTVTIDPATDAVALEIRSTNQSVGSLTSNLLTGKNAAGTAVAQLRNTGRLVLGVNTGAPDATIDGIVKLDLQAGDTQSVNIAQCVVNAATTWSLSLTGQMICTTLAPKIDIASAAAGSILTSTDVDGNTVWSVGSAVATRIQHRWAANGPYIVDTAVDGGWTVPTACSITAIWLHRNTPGTSGTTTLDVNRTPSGSTTATTIYTTQGNRPAIPFSDADYRVQATLPDVVALAVGDVITVDTDEVEAGAPANWVLTIEVA
jgi:hypothetical protein